MTARVPIGCSSASERAKLYVLAHADKLGRRPFHAWAPIPNGATLVTDASATDAQIRPFETAGIVVVRAEPSRPLKPVELEDPA